MPELTTTTSAVFIPEIWSKDIQKFVEANLVFLPLIRRFDSEVKSGGDIIHVPKLTKIAAAAKADDTDVTFTSPTETEFTLTINQNFVSGVKIRNLTAVQASYDLRKAYSDSMSYGMVERMDTSVAALYAGLSQLVDASAGVSRTLILSAIQKLDDANAPMADRSFVMKPKVKAAIFDIDGFVRFDATNTERVNNGLLGDIFGIKSYVSTNVATSVTDRNLIFHKDAFAAAVQKQPKLDAQYMVRAFAWEVGCEAIWGVAEYRDAFGVEFKTAV